MIDCIIATLPRLHTRSPITGPAILKSVLQQNNFSCHLVDWNIDLWEKVGPENSGWWIDTNTTFRQREQFDKSYPLMEPHVKEWVQYIIKENPTWFGMSLFSQRSLYICEKICIELKNHNTEIKIILGGPYTNYCGDRFLERGKCDAFIKGEGEEAMLALLKGEKHPGINGWAPQINDLDSVPIPDYSDYNFSIYSKNYKDPSIRDDLGADVLYITGSRGCVRRCTFCDIGYQWPKFRYRSPKSIANEMSTQYELYNIRNFYFTDSLINGNVKQFSNLLKELITYYKTNNIKPFHCHTQYICRPKTQLPPELYKDIAKAGFLDLAIGVESVSNNVRRDMKKYFTNEDLYYTLEQCDKNNIKISMLMMVGYPTETEDDFLETYNFFTEIKPLSDKGLVKVILGPPCDLVDGAPLNDDRHLWNIEWDDNNHWYTENNNMEIRIDRYIRLHNHLQNLDYAFNAKTVTYLKQQLKDIRAT